MSWHNRMVHGLFQLRSTLRRWLVLTRLRVVVVLKRARVVIDVAPDVRFGAGLRIYVDGGSTNTLRIGSGVWIQDAVTVQLRGGTIELGPGSSIRKGSVLNISGHLVLVGDNIISYYNVIHCAERIRLGRMASTNEFVTIVDSRHFHDDHGTFFYENVETAPIEIGQNVWIANKSSVLMGVTIGDEAIVAAHAVVHSDVPARAIVGGIPARVIRQR